METTGAETTDDEDGSDGTLIGRIRVGQKVVRDSGMAPAPVILSSADAMALDRPRAVQTGAYRSPVVSLERIVAAVRYERRGGGRRHGPDRDGHLGRTGLRGTRRVLSRRHDRVLDQPIEVPARVAVPVRGAAATGHLCRRHRRLRDLRSAGKVGSLPRPASALGVSTALAPGAVRFVERRWKRPRARSWGRRL